MPSNPLANCLKMLQQKATRLFILPSLSLILSACAVKPIADIDQAIAQHIDLPNAYLYAPQQPSSANQQPWWQTFASDELNHLIDQALNHNQDLVAAGYRWQQALNALQSSAETQKPSYNSSLSAGHSHQFNDHRHSNQYNANLGVSYQLDLWHKLSAQQSVAQWRSQASQADLASTQLSLIAQVVNAYLQLLHTQDQLKLNNAQQQHQQQTLERMRLRHQLGNIAKIDLIRSQQTQLQLDSQRHNLQAQHQRAQISLSILLGQAPQTISANHSLNDLSLPNIPTNPPAHLLRQRPDLRAQQYRLQASLGDIAVAERDFYPNLNLSAGLSAGGGQLASWLSNPVGNLSASLSLPFLERQRKKLTLQSQQLAYQEALASFSQTLYRAIAEVEQALINLANSKHNATLLNKQLSNAQTIETISEIRYQAGAESQQDWENSQENRRQIEQQRLDNRYEQLRHSVALYQALGGSATD